MITYTPFWDTLKLRNTSTYVLINHYGVSSSTINRLRHNQPVSTNTVDDLCRILTCSVADILQYVPGPAPHPSQPTSRDVGDFGDVGDVSAQPE